MRSVLTALAICTCIHSSSAFATDAPDAEISADPGAAEYNPFTGHRGSGQRIEPDMVSRTLEGASEADLVDTPTEEFVSFASILWVYFTSDTVFQFEHLDPGEAELAVVLEVARKSRVLAVELQQIRKEAMCFRLRQHQAQGLPWDQSVELAVRYYESAEVKQQEYEEVASYIREEIEGALGSEFLSDFEREAVLHGERSTATRVSSRSFFGVSNDEFVADCEG